jgi:subtilisin-like proprotein convertase family protein
MQMTLFSWTRASFTAVLILFSLPIFGQTVIIQNGTDSACGGFFTDSGGNAAGYNPNEDFTFTLCPDGTTGTHVQLIFSGVDLGAGDALTFYDGDMVDPATQFMIDIVPGSPFIVQATAANPTGCLTITFTSDGAGEAGGWSADINCIPACQLIQSILVSSNPIVEPVDTGYIDACPGERIFFTGEGMYPQNGIVYDHSDFTSDFFWDFGDGNNAVGPNVSHTYEEPGGYVVQLTITDQFGCTNTNFISQRVRISPPPTFAIGGDLDPQVCAGDTVYLNAIVDTINSNNNVSVIPNPGSFQSGGVRSDSLPLPDGTGAVYETSINFTEFSPGQVLENVNDLEGICVVMEHSWLFDLDVFLTCPDGTQIILQNQEFIGNEVFLGEPFEADDIGTPNPPGQGVGYEYCWTPNATNGTWTDYANQFDPQTLPSGDYSAFDDMSALVGCPLNGEWTIIVQDQWGSDNGWIFEWSINLNPALYPSIETFTPGIIDFAWENNPSIFYYSPDSIAAAPQNAGTANYTFEVTNDFGCTYDTTVNFAVLPFTHPDCYNCADNVTEIADAVICEGESISLDISANIPTENTVVFEAFPLYPLGFSNHPPANPYASGIDVNSVAPTVITDPFAQIESVCVTMLTDWNADMSFILRAPSGELLELSSGNGGGLDNYINTCFTPDAATSITAGTPPFTGEFQPEGDWNSLIGANIIGEWQLLVSDQFGINDIGELVSWSISFNSVNEVQYTWTPPGSLSCSDCPDPIASPASSTTYTVNYEDSYGCLYQDEIQVDVISDVSAPNVICQILTPGSGELVFDWTQVGAFTNYELNIISSVTGESGWFGPVSGTSYTVTGLQNDEEITLQVRVFVGVNGDCVVEIG